MNIQDIAFRGAYDKKSEFVEGYHAYDEDLGIHYIITKNSTKFEVDPNSLGIYTGKTDKNGVKIYTGDILSLNGETDMWSTMCGVVELRRCQFINAYNYNGDVEKYDSVNDVCDTFEVISNTYKEDNNGRED